MSDNLSDYLENKLLEHTVGKTSFTMPTGAYVALFTTAPTDVAGSGVEVTGGSYARVQSNASWAAASAGSITTNADITFPTATANWGTITDVAIFDASTAGNMLWRGPLTASKVVNSGDVFKITTGNLTLTLA